ncbi:M48 family metallopeptidase [Candidatus Albibeggiatoa sp. nov. NOAA]|uniref:M48 family metallopeptidase n=1 Tax=Candidatus Albibeggiatoa sp. nov. NOAA TaxID=3162724 RepID=UPI003300273D|nr:M48 family metallopeptidase [Thiotrichaceae bacterium]
MNSLTVVFLSVVAIGVAVQIWLAQRQTRSIKTHQGAVPEAFAEKITLESHQKAARYSLEKLGFGQKILIFETILLLVWTIGGGLNWLDQTWQTMGWSQLWTGVAVLLTMSFIGTLLELPVDLYRTFKIEEKYGFNRSTLGLFFSDMFKGLLVGLIIGVPFLALILWLMESMGEFWWLYVWAVWMGFSLLMMWAYPTFIAPLFNKFEPLEEDELKQQIVALLERNGFASNGIFVMDGSKRSAHGNAYFTGLGSNKRIVFFDTLLQDLSNDEVVAVLAHEVGHFKRKHIQKRLVSIFGLSLAGLALLGWLMQQQWFFTGLGVEQASTYVALALFSLVMPAFTFFLSPVMSWASRKHEFEADDFAAEQANPKDLIQALVKLYKENANTLTPDTLYSAFYDSHPPAPVRVAHLMTKV